MIDGHLDHRVHRQSGFVQNDPDLFEGIAHLFFRIRRHDAIGVATGRADQEQMVAGQDGRRHLQFARRRAQSGGTIARLVTDYTLWKRSRIGTPQRSLREAIVLTA